MRVSNGISSLSSSPVQNCGGFNAKIRQDGRKCQQDLGQFLKPFTLRRLPASALRQSDHVLLRLPTSALSCLHYSLCSPRPWPSTTISLRHRVLSALPELTRYYLDHQC